MTFEEDYEIYRYYFGDITVGEKINSPDLIRKDGQKDDSPSLHIYTWVNKKEEERIVWKDHGLTEDVNHSAIGLIMHIEELNFKAALNFLYTHIRTQTIGEPIFPIKKMVHVHKEAEFKIRKGYADFELDYWSRRKVTEQALKDADIRTLKWIKYGGKKVRSTREQPIFIYVFKRDKKDRPVSYQIYQPLCKKKKYKFRSYNLKDVIAGWDQLPKGKIDILYIVSSVKDREVVKNIPCVEAINPTGEVAFKVLFSNRRRINKKAKRVVIMYDADKTGTMAAIKLSEACKWNYVDCRKKLGKYSKRERKVHSKKWIKDFDELITERGEDELNKVFHNLTWKYTKKLLPF